MIVSIAVLLFIIILFAGLNFKNKSVYPIVLHITVEIFLIVICMIYVFKVGYYTLPLAGGYRFFQMFYRLHIPLIKIARLYNLCFSVLMVLSVWQCHIIKKMKYWCFFILCIPCAFFALWTDYKVQIRFYVLSYMHETPYLLHNMLRLGNLIFETVFVLYLLLPILRAVLVAGRSRIFYRKRSVIAYGAYIFLVNMSIYLLFIKGTFSCFWFRNVNISKAVTNYTITDTKILLTVIIIMLTFVFAGLCLACFRPFNMFSHFVKKYENVHSLYNNLNSVFHLYKNAFLIIQQQSYLIQQNLKIGNYDKISQIADLSSRTIEKYTRYNNRILRLLQGARGYFVPIDLYKCFENAVSITKADSEAEVIRHNGSMQIMGIEECITESFVNLIKNSLEASEETKKSLKIDFNIISEEDLCMVTFCDNASGIPPGIISKITEPFFSTKKKSLIGGLGLSYVKTVVKQHGGHMRITSKLNEYTKIQLVFPKLKQKKEARKWKKQ